MFVWYRKCCMSHAFRRCHVTSLESIISIWVFELRAAKLNLFLSFAAASNYPTNASAHLKILMIELLIKFSWYHNKDHGYNCLFLFYRYALLLLCQVLNGNFKYDPTQSPSFPIIFIRSTSSIQWKHLLFEFLKNFLCMCSYSRMWINGIPFIHCSLFIV